MTAQANAPDGPAVSVVIIFKDEERFLGEAIESVRSQTIDDWELLLVDDGSTDDSPAIARSHADRQPDRIGYLDHPGHANRGMSASRNLGLAVARGRWVAFLDGDDVWLPGKLAAQTAALARHPGLAVLVSPAQWWRSGPHGKPDEPDWVQTLGPGSAGDVVVEPPTLVLDFLDDEWRSVCDLVIRRDVAVQLGGYEERFRGMFEDQAFHAKVLSRLPALVTSSWWYRYRQHDEACTATSHRGGSHLAARRHFLDWLAEHLRETSASPDLERLVRVHRRRAHHPRLSRISRRIGARRS